VFYRSQRVGEANFGPRVLTASCLTAIGVVIAIWIPGVFQLAGKFAGRIDPSAPFLIDKSLPTQNSSVTISHPLFAKSACGHAENTFPENMPDSSVSPIKGKRPWQISEINLDAAFCNDQHLRRDVGGSDGDPRHNKVRQAVSEGTAIGAITN
jgi:hypothetical protein